MTKIVGKAHNFNIMLIVLAIYIFLLLPIVHHDKVERVLFILFYMLMLSNGLPFLISKKLFGFIFFLTLFPIAFLTTEFFVPELWVRILIDFSILSYFILLVTNLFPRAFAKGGTDRNKVQGAVVVYLLIALCFAIGYHLIFLYEGPNAIKGLLSYSRREFVYFSLSTLTTVGYGDVTPFSELARSLGNMEALIGQLYPAIIIARIVSMEINSSRSN
ncbi:MAG: ion channel [Chitinophagales bacterium]